MSHLYKVTIHQGGQPTVITREADRYRIVQHSPDFRQIKFGVKDTTPEDDLDEDSPPSLGIIPDESLTINIQGRAVFEIQVDESF